jgi:hypothetical protein
MVLSLIAKGGKWPLKSHGDSMQSVYSSTPQQTPNFSLALDILLLA